MFYKINSYLNEMYVLQIPTFNGKNSETDIKGSFILLISNQAKNGTKLCFVCYHMRSVDYFSYLRIMWNLKHVVRYVVT